MTEATLDCQEGRHRAVCHEERRHRCLCWPPRASVLRAPSVLTVLPFWENVLSVLKLIFKMNFRKTSCAGIICFIQRVMVKYD